MAYVPIPKDLSKVKTKVIFGLTKRQLILFGVALCIGVPLFFLTKNILGTSTASFIMTLIMLPCFLFAMYEKNGMHLETVIKHVITAKYLRKHNRIYMTKNIYSELEKQRKLNREVGKIVKKRK